MRSAGYIKHLINYSMMLMSVISFNPVTWMPCSLPGAPPLKATGDAELSPP